MATPIGNLSDLTARAAEVLRESGHVLAEDTRRARILLRHAASRTRPVSLHAHNEASRIGQALAWLAGGDDVALISDAGTPLLSDPGERLVGAAVAKEIDVVPVPGPSAILAALVASGLPCVPFTFLGFLPRKAGRREQMLNRVAAASDTTVLFESPARLARLLADLARLHDSACLHDSARLPADLPRRFDDSSTHAGSERRVAVCRELTKLHEEVFRGTLSEAAERYNEQPPKGEVTVVVEGRRAVEGEANPEAVRSLAVDLLQDGLAPTAAAKELAKRTGILRGDAYQAIRRAQETP